MAAERRADAAHQQRAADHAGRSRGRGTEERAAATLLRRSLHWGALLIAALLISALAALTPRIGAVSRRRRAGLWNARHRAARLFAAEQTVEEAPRLLGLLRLRLPILLLIVLNVRV